MPHHNEGVDAHPPLRVAAVLGDHSDPVFAGRLHALEHRGLVDVVWLPRADMARRRMVLRSMAGREVAIGLPRAQALFDGAVLWMSDAGALIARAEAEQWLRLTPRSPDAALVLGYHAGNLHWRVRFDGVALLVAVEGPVAGYLDRLAMLRDKFTVYVEGAAG